MQQALDEAYASAPAGEIVLHALEINHQSFKEPIRVIRWPITGPEPEKFNCLLEDDAPYNPGQLVEYFGAPFEIQLPEKSTESVGQFVIRVSNVGDMLDEYLMDAALSGGRITTIYREFTKGRESEGAGAVWPGITLSNPRMEGMDISIEGSVLDWLERPFGYLILPSDYPGAVQGI